MSILKIGQPYIKKTGDKSRLCSDVSWRERKRTLWYEVDNEFEDCLCHERIDGFLVALLPFAFLNSLDINSDGYLSERLLYQIKNILVPSLTKNISTYHPIEIEAKTDGSILKSKNAVGTALSCGVDSFYTVLKHLETELESFKLTHLTYFNIMNHPQWKLYGENSSRDFSNARINYIKPAVEDLGLKLVAVDTNFDLFYHDYDLLGTWTYRYFGPVLALQKLFDKYYWSSGYPFSHFDLSISDLALFDLLSVQCVSNENTTFYSTGSEASRLEKVEYISNFAVTYKYLNVCWTHLYNCTDKCDKCKRTLLALYALGKLECYSQVFELDRFYQNIHHYVGYMLFRNFKDKDHSYYWELYDCFLSRGIKISVRAKLYAIKMILGLAAEKLYIKNPS